MTQLERYSDLFLIRASEHAIMTHYGTDAMKTPMHMSMGEEAIVVGVCHALQADDPVLGTYRSHGLYLAKTRNVNDFFMELYGKDPAFLKGKGGSMHLSAPDQGFLGTSAIVASAIPVAAGAAFSALYQETNQVVAVFFGDGAIDEGNFWETLNLASLMQLPLLMVCQDNGFAVHTPTQTRHGYHKINQIAAQFQCDQYESDSTDVEEIYELTNRAAQKIRKTKRPAFLHLHYYRYMEHVGINEDFKDNYRDKSVYMQWLERDPVHLQRNRLLANGMSETEIAEIEKNITKQIDHAIQSASKADFSSVDALYTGVLK